MNADGFIPFANAYLSNVGNGAYNTMLDFDQLNGIDADDFIQFANRYLSGL